MLEYLVCSGKYYLAKLPAHKAKKTKTLLDSRMQLLQYTKAVNDVIQGSRDIPSQKLNLAVPSMRYRPWTWEVCEHEGILVKSSKSLSLGFQKTFQVQAISGSSGVTGNRNL